jgi:hypothetical protein
MFAVGAAGNLARNVWYWRHGQLSNWLVGSIGTLDDNLRGPSGIRFFVPLDIPVFVTIPWVDSRDDATGRCNFWNYLLRSSLSGEFKFEGPLHAAIATLWGVALLILLALLVLFAVLVLRAGPRGLPLAKFYRHAPLILGAFAWLGSVFCARVAFPYPCQGDFRFVLPVLVPLLLAASGAGRVAAGLVSVIAVSSVVFFVSL